MKLVVGLGNPGKAYANSRHNVGFQCIDGISRHAGIALSQRRRVALVGEGVLEGKELVLAKPRTFMNQSGEAVSYLMTRFRISLSDLLIIYDDLDLPLGKVRIRPSGGAGGHRGVASIIAALRSQDFPRIRVGIGRPPEGAGEVRYVLGSFTGEDGALVKQAVATVREAVTDVLGHDLDWAMNRYN
jgi:PTH1 family peptidyl-tRNA hydrolase